MTRPAARIVVEGKDKTSELINTAKGGPLSSITVTDEAGLISDRLELVIDNRDGFAAPDPGTVIQVWLGYEGSPLKNMGRYRVDEITFSGPPNILSVSAASAELTTAIKETKTRSWHEKTVGVIVGSIAGENGLGLAIDAEIGEHFIEHIDQHAESDMAFLSRLAKRHGATFKLADGKVLFAKAGSRSAPSGAAKKPTKLKPFDVATWSVTRAQRSDHKSVICYWHDHDKGKRKAEKAGSGEPAHRDKRRYRTAAEAKASAEGQLAALRRWKLDGSCEGVGNPALYAEGIISLDGFGPVDGQYLATTVTHTLDSSGYRTNVAFEGLNPDE